jgi:small subunit ribosomal protein S16
MGRWIWQNGLLTHPVRRRPLLVRMAWSVRAVGLVGAFPCWLRVVRISKCLGETTAVAVKIKLKRMGKIREPFYRIVVADARTKRDGRAIEEIGKYHPKADPSVIEVNSDRVQHWLSVGAQPTDPVRHLLTITGDWQKFKGEPGAEGTLRVAEPKADKKERYEALVKESLATKETKESKSGKKDAPAKSSRSKKSEAAKTETAKADAAKTETAKAETAKADAAKAEPAKADADKTEPAKAEPAKAEAAEAAPAEAAPAAAEASDGGTEA